jgi:hypothetical protein
MPATPPQEAQLREAEALLDDLGSAQGFARSLAARWVAALRGVAAAGADLGVALAALAEYEGSCRRVDSAGLQVAAQVGGRRGGWGGGRWVAGGWRGGWQGVEWQLLHDMHCPDDWVYTYALDLRHASP